VIRFYHFKMEFSHTSHSSKGLSSAFKIGIAINVVFISVESAFGFLSNSSALIADAGHNLSDTLALAFSWIAVVISHRKPTKRFTYGFRRSTILVAMLNTILLLAVVVFITIEAIDRLRNPSEINTRSVIVIAAVGILVNGLTAWLFIKDKKKDLNIRSTFVHFVADALLSLGVVAAGVMITFTGFVWIDPLVSLVIVAIILLSAIRLLVDSVSLALDAVPEGINIQAVSNYLKQLPEVKGIHDLHIWALSTTDVALSVHLCTSKQTDLNFISTIQQQLQKQFNIEHSTIQVEYGVTDSECTSSCHPN